MAIYYIYNHTFLGFCTFFSNAGQELKLLIYHLKIINN
jgi:hypothetical protein